MTVNIQDYIVSEEAINDNIEEIEIEVYGYCDNIESLVMKLRTAKSMETQEQWNLKFNKKEICSEVRVRKCVTKDRVYYTLANKLRIDTLDHPWELEKEIDQHHFEMIKEMSKNGMVKDRYFFPIDGTDMVWEVDVFHDKNGNITPWVKLDLESHVVLKSIPDYPIECSEWIEEQKRERSPETIDFIDKLYKNKYIIKKSEK